MRRIILRMIASGSLAAFSTATQPLGPTGRAGGAGPIYPARTTATAPQQQPQPLTLQPQAGGPAPTQNGRPLPRGSLLDLSV